MLKKDIYRIFRALTAIRRGVHWINHYSTKSIRYDLYLQQNLKYLFQLQNDSNSFLQLVILMTTIFIAFIELTRGLLLSREWIVSSGITYFAVIACLFTYFRIKNKRIQRSVGELENDFINRVSTVENELETARLKDEVLTSMIERKILEEMAEDYLDLAKKGEISVDAAKNEIENIRELSKELGVGFSEYLKKLDAIGEHTNEK